MEYHRSLVHEPPLFPTATEEMMHLLGDVLTDAWKELRKDDPAWLGDPTGDPR